MLPQYQVKVAVESAANAVAESVMGSGAMHHPVTLGRNLGAAADTMAIKGL